MAFSNGPKIVTDGLVLNLSAFDRNSYVSGSTTWNDVSGQGNNGTLVNGPTFNSGNGGYIRLDGTNDYITLPTIGFAFSSITVDIWVRQYSSNSNGYIWIMDNFDSPELRIGVSSNKFRVYFYDTPYGYITNGVLSTTTLNTTNFFNIVSTITNGSQKVYINGKLEISTTGNYNANSSNNLYEQTLGTYNRPSPGYNGYGTFDYGAYRVYNRALSFQEVLQNYNATKSRFGL
jgi:hypothetical protein